MPGGGARWPTLSVRPGRFTFSYARAFLRVARYNRDVRPTFAIRTVLIPWALAAACAAPAGAQGAAEPSVPAGFTLEVVAHVRGARELAATPNGDLFVGTGGSDVYFVPDAEGTPQSPRIFATLPDRAAAGVALGDGALFVGTHQGVWRISYTAGERKASGPPQKLATVRPGNGGGHATTSVALGRDVLYVSVGSSCNACTESDPTRATIQEIAPGGGDLKPKAVRIRNAIALAIDPATDALWAGVAGQDELEHGHPYEIFDDVTAHPGVADYGWPDCYENRKAARPGADCAHVPLSRVVFPAYETPIGATFYPLHPAGAHAFPATYRGGAFVALHGSWHQPPVPPRVAFVPMRGDDPEKPVDWNDPNVQWKTFVDGFQAGDGSRIGRPTGVAVGAEGSLFVADDAAGVVYRIRPAGGAR